MNEYCSCFLITELCVKFIKNICNHSPAPMLVTDLELMVSFLERTNCLPSPLQLHAWNWWELESHGYFVFVLWLLTNTNLAKKTKKTLLLPHHFTSAWIFQYNEHVLHGVLVQGGKNKCCKLTFATSCERLNLKLIKIKLLQLKLQ